MKHLILGSSGLIGTYLADHINALPTIEYVQKEDTVIEYDLQRTPQEDLRYETTNLYDKMKECDFVHFLAFDIGGSEYMKKYQYSYDFISNNIKIMQNVFDMLRITGKPFYFASSQMSNMSHTTYGVLKHLGEYYTKALNGLIIKFWNVYGIEKEDEKSHVITDFIRSAKYKNKIEMRTDGKEMRQFLHGKDCAPCLLELAKNYENLDKGKEYHITSFEWVSILRLAEMISSIYGNGNCSVIPGTASDTLQGGFKNEPDETILKYWRPHMTLIDGLLDVGGQI